MALCGLVVPARGHRHPPTAGAGYQPLSHARSRRPGSRVLWEKDVTASLDPGFTGEIARICGRFDISHTFKDAWIEEQNLARSKPLSLGRTEIGHRAAANAGNINGTTLQIPTTGYHTASETASLAAIRMLGTNVS